MAIDTPAIARIENVHSYALHAHPSNSKIYGDEDVSELAEKIKFSKWIKPLVITHHNRIISGHRRWQAAISLGFISVPVERRTFANEIEELEALLLENQFREKTPEQKVREAGEWRKIEDDKAHQRMSYASKAQSQGVQNFAHPENGKTRDKVAGRVGFGSGFTYEKAAKVVAKADILKNQGKIEEGQALLNVLNTQSVDAASKVLHLPEPEQVAVLETLAKGQANKVKDAVNTVRKQEKQEAVNSLLQVDSLPAPIIKEAHVQPGQLWQLGRHFLYCGDSSSDEFINFARSIRLTFAFADPPYNADAATWDRNFKWAHDYLIDLAPVVAVTPGISSIKDFMSKTALPYKWSMACHIDNGMTRGALGFGNWIYVAIFAHGSIHRNAQDHERVSISSNDRDDLEHKGRKPLAMMLHLVKLFTQESETVIDPFMGTGTTLIVCEQTKRACIGAEINPEYCQSIIRRWEAVTGLKGVLLQWP